MTKAVGQSSQPGVQVPIDDVTQIGALAMSEVMIATELAQRQAARETLEANRTIADAALAAEEYAKEQMRIQTIEQHKQDGFVTGASKPAVVELTARELYLQETKIREEQITAIKEKLTSRTENPPEEGVENAEPPKTFEFNESGELVGGENLTEEDYEQNKQDLAELTALQESQSRADSQCGAHWYCTGCELLDSNWADVNSLKNAALEMMGIEGLDNALANKNPSAFARALKCLEQMGSSKTGEMVTAVALAGQSGYPAMLNEGINHLPIGNKRSILRNDIVRCGERMLQDPTSISRYQDVLRKVNIGQDELFASEVPGLGIAAIDMRKANRMMTRGDRFARQSLGSDKFNRVRSLQNNEAFSAILNY